MPARCGSRKGGSERLSPSVSIGSSAAKPGMSWRSRTDPVRLAEVERAEVVALHLSGRRDAELADPLRPSRELRVVGGAEGDVVDAAGPFPRHRGVGVDGDVQLGPRRRRGPSRRRHGLAGRPGRAVVAHGLHVHHVHQHGGRRADVRHGQRDRAEPLDLVLGRNRAALPQPPAGCRCRRRGAGAALPDPRRRARPARR